MIKNICPLSLIGGGAPKPCEFGCKFRAENGECYLAVLIRRKAIER